MDPPPTTGAAKRPTEDLERLDGSVKRQSGKERSSVETGGARTAWELLSEEEKQRPITTGCGDLDGILGGGVHCKQVTEVGGVPGTGKTQLGIQLVVNVQIPYAFGGLGGKAIYIDTEGSFMAERAYQIAQACIEDAFPTFALKTKGDSMPDEKMHPNSFLASIFYFRVCSYPEQVAVINHLEKFLLEHRDVRVVVIDSISFQFRQDFNDLALRTRVLTEMSLKLMKLAKCFNLAVVLLNQVTTKFAEGSYHLSLALGDSWSHARTNRIILYWDGKERFAYLDKSPSLPSASSAYSITGRGIRNVAQHKKVHDCREN